MKYVALLRGINVGKGARVPMKTLKALLEGLGLSDVVTYLNSGNVVFESGLERLRADATDRRRARAGVWREDPYVGEDVGGDDRDRGVDTERVGQQRR